MDFFLAFSFLTLNIHLLFTDVHEGPFQTSTMALSSKIVNSF